MKLNLNLKEFEIKDFKKKLINFILFSKHSFINIFILDFKRNCKS